MYFCLYGLCIDAVIINRIFPEIADSAFFGMWKQTQQRYIDEAANYFLDMPIWKVHLFDDEVVGEKGLRRLADVLYAGIDPADIFREERPYQFSKDEGCA